MKEMRMGMSENGSKDQALGHLKVEFAVKQKKGLPFIMASTVLWTIMLIALLCITYASRNAFRKNTKSRYVL